MHLADHDMLSRPEPASEIEVTPSEGMVEPSDEGPEPSDEGPDPSAKDVMEYLQPSLRWG